MKIRLVVPDEHLSAAILDPALEAVTRANEALIHAGRVPLFEDALKAGKVVWKPEPKGQKFEAFDLATTVLDRGWGDCDDLAPWKAASARARGDHDARAFARKSDNHPMLWHASTALGDGREDDPSCAAGMKCKPKGATPVTPAMHGPGRVALATLPWQGRVAARFDLPWDGGPYGISGLAVEDTAPRAIVQAIQSALHTAKHSGVVHPSDVSRGLALHDAICGGDANDIAHAVAEIGLDGEAAYQAVGSLWGSIKKAAHHISHAVPVHALTSLASAPIKLAAKQAGSALAMTKALATGHPGEALKAAREGLHELTSNPAFSGIQALAPAIPGLGPVVSSGMTAAAALGEGLSLREAATSALRAAVPPGPAQAAFDAAVGLAHGHGHSDKAIYAARQQLPPKLRPSFDKGLHAATKIKRPVPAALAPMIVRLLGGRMAKDRRTTRWGARFTGTLTNDEFTITVVNPSSVVSIAMGETISSISPPFQDTGAVATPVVILGVGFTGATGARINGVALTSFVVVSDAKITATVPALPATTGTPYTLTILGTPYGTLTKANAYVVRPVAFVRNPTLVATLFQDQAGTTPVTAPGQPVRHANDTGPAGNYGVSSGAGTQATYSASHNGMLVYAVTSDILTHATVNFGPSTHMAFTVVNTVGQTANFPVLYIDQTSDDAGVFANQILPTDTTWADSNAGATVLSSKRIRPGGPPIFDGGTHVYAHFLDGTDAGNILAVDGVVQTPTIHPSTGNAGARTDILRSGDVSLIGSIGIEVHFNATLSLAETEAIRPWILSQHGL